MCLEVVVFLCIYTLNTFGIDIKICVFVCVWVCIEWIYVERLRIGWVFPMFLLGGSAEGLWD